MSNEIQRKYKRDGGGAKQSCDFCGKLWSACAGYFLYSEKAGTAVRVCDECLDKAKKAGKTN